jgi:cell shape-determining protein MreD
MMDIKFLTDMKKSTKGTLTAVFLMVNFVIFTYCIAYAVHEHVQNTSLRMAVWTGLLLAGMVCGIFAIGIHEVHKDSNE